jgi:hypothetical protein
MVLWFVVSYNAWFVASLEVHCAVVCFLSYKAWFVTSLAQCRGLLSLIKPGLLSLL